MSGPITGSFTFNNAPLVELVVEAQWEVPSVQLANGPKIITDASPLFDKWFQQLSTKLKESGHDTLERLIPHDAPPLAHHPIFRFKKGNEQFPLTQFGHGVFTVNAGPPGYISWDNFKPIVQQNLEALIASIPSDLSIDNFRSISLRYIDAFNDSHKNGASNFSFINDILGIKIELPQNLFEYSSSLDLISPTILLRIPLQDGPGTLLNFKISSGKIKQQGELLTILDMTYVVTNHTNFSSDSALTLLDKAHDTLHDWFMKLTQNQALTKRMGPGQPS